MLDYYRILEVHPEASPEVIQRAYRTLSKKYHPDQFHTSRRHLMEEQMKQLNEAYRILSNPVERSRYQREFERHQNSAPQRERREKQIATIRKLFVSAALTVLGVMLVGATVRLFAFTPVGRLVLLVAACWFAIKIWKRHKATRRS